MIKYVNVCNRGIVMAAISKEDYNKMLDSQNEDMRNKVMEGLAQIKEGKTKDFNSVCGRLEKKYPDE